MRLDNVIFRLGMAPTIAAARQIVGHKHITVNNSCVSIASYQCKPGDVVSLDTFRRKFKPRDDDDGTDIA